MSHDAAAQLRRLLHLIPKLADGEALSLRAVGALAGTDADTVLRDIQSLSARFGDEPGGFVEGVEIYLEVERVSLRASHFARPMRLTAPELCALELGLAMMRAERPPEEHGAIDRARERLRAALARLPGAEIADDLRHASLGAGGDARHLAALRRGVRARRKVRLAYRKADSSETSERVVCPYGLVAARGSWYVFGRCERSDAVRIFRLDRIEGVDALDDAFEPPPALELDSVIREGKVFRAEEPGTLRVRYAPRIARWVAEREGAPLDADGSLTLEHPLADAEWAVRHVLQYGPDAEVLAPASVRDAMRERLEALCSEAATS
ncbi:MAG: WYL domain-containing protein [Gemmatimonadaceae bacterium]